MNQPVGLLAQYLYGCDQLALSIGLPVTGREAGHLMNVWALNKDNAIRRLLHALVDRFGPDALAISGRWEKDESAVGIFRPGEESMLAYIFTYGQETGRYGLHLEYPGANGLGTTTMIENIDMNHLIELLQAHFNI